MDPQNQVRKPVLSAGRVLTACLLMMTVAGCKQFIILSYLIGGPPSIEPEFDRQTGHELTEYGVKVAVVCYAPDELKWDYDSVDDQLAGMVARQLQLKKIDVIDPPRVMAWLQQNPDWDSAQDIGAGLVDSDDVKPTHIIYIDLEDYDLYEENSNNLYRGRADATVKVVKMNEDGSGKGDQVFVHQVKSVYPILTAISTSTASYSTFKGQYMVRLSEEIGRLFYEHYAGDDIQDGA